MTAKISATAWSGRSPPAGRVASPARPAASRPAAWWAALSRAPGRVPEGAAQSVIAYLVVYSGAASR